MRDLPWFAVWAGLFTPEHAKRLKPNGKALLLDLLYLANLRGDLDAGMQVIHIRTSVSELASLSGAKRETVRATLARISPRYVDYEETGHARYPLLVSIHRAKTTRLSTGYPQRVAKIGQEEAGAVQKVANNGHRGGQNRPGGVAKIGHQNRRNPAQRAEYRPPQTSKTRESSSSSIATSARSPEEWQARVLPLFERLNVNAATRRRVDGLGLPLPVVYSAARDCLDRVVAGEVRRAKAGGWLWVACRDHMKGRNR